MSRLIASWLIALLVLQGFAAAGQRVLPGGHFHALLATERGHHGADDAHFHLAIGFHQHAFGTAGVVEVDADDDRAVETVMSQTLKRLELDQPQLRTAGAAGYKLAPRAAAPAADAFAWRSHVSAPQERPPRCAVA